MKWIEKIVEVNPYEVVCKWNDGMIREVDLRDFVHNYAKILHSSYAQLIDKTRFAEVRCDGSTLYWEDGLEFEDYDGQIKKGPLDIALKYFLSSLKRR